MSRSKSGLDPVRDVPSHLRHFQAFIGARMYLVFLLTLLAILADSVGILMLLPLLQALDGANMGTPDGLSRLPAEMLSYFGLNDSVAAILLVMASIFLLKGLLLFVAHAYKAYLYGQLMRELKGRMYGDFNRMSLQYYVSKDTGHFINVINGQINGFIFGFNHMVALGTVVIKALVYLAVAFLVAWRFGLMAIIFGVIVLLGFRRLNVYVREISRKTSFEAGNLAKLLIQALQSFKYLTSTAKNEQIGNGVRRSIHRLTGYEIRNGIAAALTESIREPLAVVAILIIVMIQLLWLDQPLAPIVVAILLFHRALGAMLSTQGAWQRFLSHVGALELVTDEFARQAQHREAEGFRDIGPFRNEIVLKDVHFSYGTGQPSVLKGVSLTIPANGSIAIVGESGAGKSTLVDLLTLMLKPSEGTISIDGVLGTEIRQSTWRRQVGYVSQETVVFDDTVANNICLWDGDIDRDPELFARIREAARMAYIDHVIEKLPEGYRSRVGDRGVRLSGGQRQRLFIARELFKRPNLLILDEATSALDSESELAIRKSIDGLRGQLTLVVIAHRLATIRNVDRIFVLDKGLIAESGSYDSLARDSSTQFSRLVATQRL